MNLSLSKMRRWAERVSASLRVMMFVTFEIVVFAIFLREIIHFAFQ
jgi:hypothetical protein